MAASQSWQAGDCRHPHCDPSTALHPSHPPTHPPHATPTLVQVDRLIAQRTRLGRRQFLVKWRGLGYSECTWEKEAALKEERVCGWLNGWVDWVGGGMRGGSSSGAWDMLSAHVGRRRHWGWLHLTGGPDLTCVPACLLACRPLTTGAHRAL